MRRLRRWISYSRLLWLVLIPSACAGSQRPTTPGSSDLLTGVLPISVPETMEVGSTVEVTVGPVVAPNGTSVVLTAIGSYGARLYQTVIQDGRASFNLKPEDTRTSGVVTLVASSGSAHGEGRLTLVPGPLVDPLTPLVGSRTIVANGSDWSMTVVVPFDQFGNPVAEGTPLQLQALHPNGRLDRHRLEVRHLLAWSRIYSGTRSGRTRITVRTPDVQGPEATLLEVAGWPVPFKLTAEPETLPANGQDLMTLRTNIIVDQFNNVVPDGTLVTFAVAAPNSQPYRIPSYTVNGQAEAQLQAPTQPGATTVRALVGQVESDVLQVTFTSGPAVGTFPVTADVDVAGGAVIIEAGPMLGPLGQYIPDGTSARFVVRRDSEVREYTTASENGIAKVDLRVVEFPPGDYTVNVTAGSGRGSTTFTVAGE